MAQQNIAVRNIKLAGVPRPIISFARARRQTLSETDGDKRKIQLPEIR
jgi:hypothetical protein